MKKTFKVAVAGYGNLGKGVELALSQNDDFELVTVFTRRDPQTLALQTKGVKAASFDDLPRYAPALDAVLLCGGSAKDVPEQAPEILRHAHCVDSFDTHNKIPDYLAQMDGIGKRHGKLALVSTGWDPGLFSVLRLMFGAFLPVGTTNTFWGKGVSQGHSDAIRRVPGVKKGIQYTVPKQDAVAAARRGETPNTREKHLRECFVVADERDRAAVERAIVTMPDYFAGYDTVVHFISDAEFDRSHTAMPHGGTVLHSGTSAAGHQSVLELSIAMQSNPEFTAAVMVAYARGLLRLASEGRTGALTVFDIPPAMIFKDGRDAAIQKLL